jgi:hypothetical protein
LPLKLIAMYLKTVTQRAVFKIKHQTKPGCEKPSCGNFMFTFEQMKFAWEWHNHPWLKHFRILTSLKITTLFQLQTTIIGQTLLLLVFWVTQTASGLTQVSMVKVRSKCRGIGPMPLLKNYSPYEPQKITDVHHI